VCEHLCLPAWSPACLPRILSATLDLTRTVVFFFYHQANYSLGADISVHAVGGVVDFSGHINVYKTLVRQAVGTGDFVVRGVCQDVGVSDFDSVDGRTCDAEEVTCDKAHAGTSPLDGSTIAAPRACCKCPGGGLTPPDYSIGGRCKFDYDISGTVGYTEHFSVSGAGLLNLNNGTTLIKSCNSKDGDPEECKCADSRVTMDDLNWCVRHSLTQSVSQL
jgi:hypothetical protein